MSILSNATGINIDVTKAVENLAVDAGEQFLANKLKSAGIEPTVKGVVLYFKALAEKDLVAKYPGVIGNDIKALLEALYNSLEPDIPDITL
jgi:hypothetical protein